MKIYNSVITNQYKYKPSFKGNDNDWHVFGIDEGGQSTRDYIRAWHEKSVIHQNNGRMNPEQIEKLFGNLFRNYPPVNNEQINKIGLVNLAQIGNNSYRGAMVSVSDPKELPKLKKLKDAGIKHIIDLDKTEGLEEECKKLGLNYLYFKHIDAYNIVFEHNGYWDNWNQYHKKDAEFFEKCRPVLDSIVKLIQTMQKGNVYIGCRNGTDYTDCALCLDYLFNPKSNHDSYADSKKNYYCRDHYFSTRHWTEDIPRIEYLIGKFTNTDLKKMGWTSNPIEAWNIFQSKYKILKWI